MDRVGSFISAYAKSDLPIDNVERWSATNSDKTNVRTVVMNDCVPWVAEGSGYVEGITCTTPQAIVRVFPNILPDSCAMPLERAEDRYTRCRPLEFNGRPSVVCDGERSSLVYTPTLPSRFFDSVDGWLMLGRVVWYSLQQRFQQVPVADKRYQLVYKVTLEQQRMWWHMLKGIEDSLEALVSNENKEGLKWIRYRLEDRQAEYEQLCRDMGATDEVTEAFTESLLALEEMISEIGKQLPSEPFSSQSNWTRGDYVADENKDKLACEMQNGNYQYWLQQQDIARIARVSYGYGTDESPTLFEIVGSRNHLAYQIQGFKAQVESQGETRPLTLIVNIEGNHWISLVIIHQDSSYKSYYVDSLGISRSENQAFLSVGVTRKEVQRVLSDNGILQKDLSIPQQTDGYNCGLWALENAADLNQMLEESRSLAWIKQRLARPRSAAYFDAKRETLGVLGSNERRIESKTVPVYGGFFSFASHNQALCHRFGTDVCIEARAVAQRY